MLVLWNILYNIATSCSFSFNWLTEKQSLIESDNVDEVLLKSLSRIVVP